MHSGMTASEDAIGLPLAPPAAAACISRSTASLSSTRPSAGRSCASPVAGSTTPGVAGVLTTALPVGASPPGRARSSTSEGSGGVSRRPPLERRFIICCACCACLCCCCSTVRTGTIGLPLAAWLAAWPRTTAVALTCITGGTLGPAPGVPERAEHEPPASRPVAASSMSCQLNSKSPCGGRSGQAVSKVRGLPSPSAPAAPPRTRPWHPHLAPTLPAAHEGYGVGSLELPGAPHRCSARIFLQAHTRLGWAGLRRDTGWGEHTIPRSSDDAWLPAGLSVPDSSPHTEWAGDGLGLGSSESLSAKFLRSAAHSIQLVAEHNRFGMHIRLALRPPERPDRPLADRSPSGCCCDPHPSCDPHPKNGRIGVWASGAGAAEDDDAGSASASRRAVSSGENIGAGADATEPTEDGRWGSDRRTTQVSATVRCRHSLRPDPTAKAALPYKGQSSWLGFIPGFRARARAGVLWLFCT